MRAHLYQFRASVVGAPVGQPLRGGAIKVAPGRQVEIGVRHATEATGRPDTTTARAANDGQGRAYRAAVVARAQPHKASGDEDVD